MAETRLAVFDLDGTLVDSAPDLAAAVDAALATRGLPPAGEARVRRWIGNGARAMVERALAWAGADCGTEEAGGIYRAFLDFYAAHVADRSRLYPGIASALDDLAERGVVLAVATNKSERLARLLLQTLGLGRRFAALVGGDTLAEKKPSPAPLLEIAGRVGVAPAAAAMLGDAEVDIRAARAAGMRSLAACWGYGDPARLAAAGPDLLLAAAGELPSAVGAATRV